MIHSTKAEHPDERKIAIYARKSKITESGKSVENQIAKCKRYADVKFDATELDLLIYQDEGRSGYYSDRPQYLQMLRDITEGKIRAVICYKFDRISRKTLDLLNLVEQLRVKKIAFISCTDDVDTSSKTGKIVMSLLASIAEFERDIIAERIADNMYELAKEGRWLGGTTPLGFWSKKEQFSLGGRKSTCNHLEPVEEEQRVVQALFAVFLEKRSLGKVVDWANENKRITRRGKAHTRMSVKNILQNPVYAIADPESYAYFQAFAVTIYAQESDFDGVRGLMIYNKTEQTKELREDSTSIQPSYVSRKSRRAVEDWIISVGKHRGIISGQDWIAVQQVLHTNREKNMRPKEQTQALLAGLIHCPLCKKAMYTHRESGRYTEGKPRFLYKCQTHKQDKNACPCHDVKGNCLDQLVLDALGQMGNSCYEDYCKRIRDEVALQVSHRDTQSEQQQWERAIQRLERELAGQTQTLRMAPESIKAVLLSDLATLVQQREQAQQQLCRLQQAQMQTPQPLIHLDRARQLILSFPTLLEQLPYTSKLALVQNIIARVYVFENTEGDDVVHLFIKGTSEKDEQECCQEHLANGQCV